MATNVLWINYGTTTDGWYFLGYEGSGSYAGSDGFDVTGSASNFTWTQETGNTYTYYRAP